MGACDVNFAIRADVHIGASNNKWIIFLLHAEFGMTPCCSLIELDNFKHLLVFIIVLHIDLNTSSLSTSFVVSAIVMLKHTYELEYYCLSTG